MVLVEPGVPGLWQAGEWMGSISMVRRGWVHVQFGWAPEPGARVGVSEVGPAAGMVLGLAAASGVWKLLLLRQLLQPGDLVAIQLPGTWEAPWKRPGSPAETKRGTKREVQFGCLIKQVPAILAY